MCTYMCVLAAKLRAVGAGQGEEEEINNQNLPRDHMAEELGHFLGIML